MAVSWEEGLWGWQCEMAVRWEGVGMAVRWEEGVV